MITTTAEPLEDFIGKKLSAKGDTKGFVYYQKQAKSLGRGIYDVLCDIEKVMDYDELLDIFSEYSNIEKAYKVDGDVIRIDRLSIVTTKAIYIWHFTSLRNHTQESKKVFLISKELFQNYVRVEKKDGEDVTRAAFSREWFVNTIVKPAIKVNATDVHMIPDYAANVYKIVFRVMGDMKNTYTLEKQQGTALASLLLYWAKEFTPSLDVGEIYRPQDGRIVLSREHTGISIDIRLSFIPQTNKSDVDIVMRLLYKVDMKYESLTNLGFSAIHTKMLNDVSERNRGIVLVTGATGSGKSRTINTVLSGIGNHRNILTAEDPIEYVLGNARQFQVFEWETADGTKNKVDFGGYAKAFKRHDPDVIFIGELRDKETVDAAFHLSKTGHLVFATLHASRATMVPEILINDYGVDINVVMDNLHLVVNQILVKKLCDKCKTEMVFEEIPVWISMLQYYDSKTLLSQIKDTTGYVAGNNSGCHCVLKHNNTEISKGYSGRTVITECIGITPEMFADGNISVSSMDAKSYDAYGNILSDAIDKLRQGIVDIQAFKRLL